MTEHSTHIRHVLLYEFESRHSAAGAHRNLSQVFGTEAPSERCVRAWFQRFKVGNNKLEDEPRSGRPTAISFDELKNLAEQHPYEGVRYFASSLRCLLSTVSNGLRYLGMVKKLGSEEGDMAETLASKFIYQPRVQLIKLDTTSNYAESGMHSQNDTDSCVSGCARSRAVDAANQVGIEDRDPPTTTTTLPPPCQTCPQPVYRNNCNGVQRPPCPSAAQANVQTANSGTDCILTFVCPAGTNAFVWPNGGNTLISYSGTDLVCDGPSGNQWRTDMGLNVESLSCIGPVPVLGCGFCPTFAQVYVDCTMYGRVDCYPDPATIVADIQRNGAQCDLDVQCPYGATLHYIVGGGTPVDTFNALATLSCTMAGGKWEFGGVAVDEITCMSDP
ncbi:hypothetical protein RB195_017231 [Necator americanus]|uniref:Mos1 transposase HTH domain-containing protein n=1 Tax=Necator americanus TaxID=51031 RepID=A0ABR1C6Q2_NECAM